MKITINVDDQLIEEAMRRSGIGTKREVIEEGLRLVISVRRQAGIRNLRGKVRWGGTTDETRTDHSQE